MHHFLGSGRNEACVHKFHTVYLTCCIKLGDKFANGAFIGQHGSWNRVPPSGYKVVYIPFNDRGFPDAKAKPIDVLTGFLSAKNEAQGRPAGVAIDKSGALLVADDAGNRIWRVSAAAKR